MRPLLSTLADVILFLHAIVVLLNVGAVAVIWVGHFRGWAFVRMSAGGQNQPGVGELKPAILR